MTQPISADSRIRRAFARALQGTFDHAETLSLLWLWDRDFRPERLVPSLELTAAIRSFVEQTLAERLDPLHRHKLGIDMMRLAIESLDADPSQLGPDLMEQVLVEDHRYTPRFPASGTAAALIAPDPAEKDRYTREELASFLFDDHD